MTRLDYLKSLGFVDVTEQVKNEIKANPKITKAMQYALDRIEYYELRFVIHPEYIDEKSVIFVEKYTSNYKYINDVIENKTSFSTEYPEKIKSVGKIYLDKHSSYNLTTKGHSIDPVLEGFEFFMTGNPELPHHTEHYDWGDYEDYPQKYRMEYIHCEY